MINYHQTRMLRRQIRRRYTQKVFPTAADAIQKSALKSGQTMLVGGFGLCGIPMATIKQISETQAINNLTIVSNNCGVADWGLGVLLRH